MQDARRQTDGAAPLMDAARRVYLECAAAGGFEKHHLLRATIPIPYTPPLDWLQAGTAGPPPHRDRTAAGEGDHHRCGTTEGLRFYGSARNHQQSMEVGGIGVADGLAWEQPVSFSVALQAIDRALRRSSPDIRYYGGFRFSSVGPVDPLWRYFGFARFIVPRYELVSCQGKSVLSLHFRPDEWRNGTVERIARAWPENGLGETEVNRTLPRPVRREDGPDYAGWEASVHAALQAMARGDVQKVVLARRVRFDFDSDGKKTACGAPHPFHEGLDPILLLRRLKAATPRCYHFCYMPVEGVAFVGASPEKLYTRNDRVITTEALAGTRMRGKTPAEDAAWGAALLASDKEQREHAFVRDHIVQALQPLCQALAMDSPARLLKLARGQHLHSPAQGTLRASVNDADILEALHPTAALGGVPRDAAMRCIRQWEPYDRGWYGGPVGWVAQDSAEFAVAIRCGLVAQHRLTLYSGAGIVPGSSPQNEWDEIELKIQDFIKVMHES